MVGLLNAYHFDFSKGSYQEQYSRDAIHFLWRTFGKKPVCEYKVARGDWPARTDECDVWVITGSSKSVYEQEPWIEELSEWVRRLHKDRRKLIGICFGHQMIAHALGGRTEKSKKGWGVGVQAYAVTRFAPWMQPEKKEVKLLFSHQDQVVKLPPEAKLLAESEFCPNQMFQIGDHILTMQGHPEFTREFAKDRLDQRIELIGKEAYAKAVASLALPSDEDTLSGWLRNFVSQS
jgi:GMP synthase-like glutamine amidotransferase